MDKDKKTPININGTDYFYEDLTEQEQLLVNHVADLTQKINQAKFNLDQLEIAKEAFFKLLTESLNAEKVGE